MYDRTPLPGFRLAAVLALPALLGACKGDESTPRAAFCQTIGGGGATASQVCPTSCGISNGPAAVDGNFDTHATLGLSVQTQGALRGTAQDGIAFPEGKLAGVYFQQEALQNGTFQFTINTYLDGVPVDSELAYSDSDNGGTDYCASCIPNGPDLFVGIATTGPFDAIEIAYSQNGTQYRELNVFELCTRDP